MILDEEIETPTSYNSELASKEAKRLRNMRRLPRLRCMQCYDRGYIYYKIIKDFIYNIYDNVIGSCIFFYFLMIFIFNNYDYGQV